MDILMISETKLDDCFPIGQFLIKGFSTPFRLIRNCHGGGILLCIREDIPSKLPSIEENTIEDFYIAVSLKNKKKWLLRCFYNPHKALIGSHRTALSKSIDLCTSKYKHLLFLGDFNAGTEGTSIKNFCNSFNLTPVW